MKATTLCNLGGVGGSRSLPMSAQRPIGGSRVIAKVPANPGFPEWIAVRGNRLDIRSGELRDLQPIEGSRIRYPNGCAHRGFP